MPSSKHRTFIVAEAGVNHAGDPNRALQMVEAAAEANADAVKFQTFNAKALVTSTTPKAEYQKSATGETESQQEMLAGLQLDYETHYRLKYRAEECGIAFISTAFDESSLSFLANDLKLSLLKIGSGELTNGPLLLQYARTRCNLIMSTGMSTLEEIREALSVLAFGLTQAGSPLSTEECDRVFRSEKGQEALLAHVTLLHCTTQYPTPFSSVNLNAMGTLREAFGLEVGYSDHTIGETVSCAAVALGARVIEKHFTLDKALPGPDHLASLLPEELKKMIKSVRTIEEALGNGCKVPQNGELENRTIARKTLIAACRIERGQLFSQENLAIKRAGSGRSPMDYWSLLGTTAEKTYESDETI